MALLRLSSGEYLGRILHRTGLFGLPLTLSAYPSGHTYPWHVHEIPTLFVLLAGQILGARQSLAEVALQVGFADQAHFTRACSRDVGCTPGQLQRMRKELFPEPAGSSRSKKGAAG